jgi:L-aminoadipate-semialdehyde dehydrogenase
MNYNKMVLTLPLYTNKKMNYWIDHLQGATELVLPSDYSWVRGRSIVEAEVQSQLSQHLSKCLLQLSLETDAVPFTLILAAFSVIVARHSGSTDIVLVSSSPNNNPILLRFQVGLDMSFSSLVALVQRTEEEAFMNEIPFSELDQHLDDTMRALLRIRFFNAIDASPETLSSIRSDASCDLTVFVSQSKTLRRLLPIDLQLVYNAALFSEGRIQEMLAQIELILTQVTIQPETSIGHLSLITQNALSVLPQPTSDLEWGQFEGPITDIFAKHAQKTPEKCCVVEAKNQVERQWSYRSIYHGMNVLSHYLIECGIQREDVVALYSYRGVDLVVAIMGVLQAGATFCVIGKF